MSDEHTKIISVKRKGAKKSGYEVSGEGDDYRVSKTPARARVAPGDKIVSINGVGADDFADADEANDLIESCQLVVVPKDELEEYDRLKAEEEAAEEGGDDEEDDDDEDLEESARRGKGKKGKGVPDDALVESAKRGKGKKKEKDVHHCNHCGHENEDLEVDEDGDLVCEECGEIIDSGEKVIVCVDCGHHNVNPERDEDGDMVCEECGHVLPEPVPCGACGHENYEPEPDENGICTCEECGEPLGDPNAGSALVVRDDEGEDETALVVHEENEDDGGGGGGGGGDAPHPSEQFNPGDVITITVGKANPKQDAGIKIEQRDNKKYYVRKVAPKGLFGVTPVIVGDKLLELNGKDTHDYKNLNEMKKVIRDEGRITIMVVRMDPEASESSASSVLSDDSDEVDDYDDGELSDFEDVEGTGALVVRNDSDFEEEPGMEEGGYAEDDEDDTEGYDGEYCGCVWCPDCTAE